MGPKIIITLRASPLIKKDQKHGVRFDLPYQFLSKKTRTRGNIEESWDIISSTLSSFDVIFKCVGKLGLK